MTERRLRTPMRVPVPTLAYAPAMGDATMADLFPKSDIVTDMEPHPAFAARAAIWRDHAAGLISTAEAQRRSAAVGAPQPAPHEQDASTRGPEHRPRHTRPEPHQSRQYALGLATTAMRDDRITPNAKALLAVLRARCGKGTSTTTTKGTLAAVMSRSARTIRRYLLDLVRFGYVVLTIRTNGRGLHVGLTVTLTSKVLPFFAEPTGLARWLAETPAALTRPFTGSVLTGKAGVTLLTPKNQTRRFFPLAKDRWLSNGRMGEVSAPS